MKTSYGNDEPQTDSLMTLRIFAILALRPDDPAATVEQLNGVLKTGKARQHGDQVYVELYSTDDAFLARVAASDHIESESWALETEDGEEGYTHRVDGPAKVHRRLDGQRREDYYLWDQHLPPDQHADAVAEGVASDMEAFKAWWSKRRRSLKRQGYDVDY